MDDVSPKVEIQRSAVACCPECGTTMYSRAGVYACKHCRADFIFARIERTPFGDIPRPADMTQVKGHDIEEAEKILRGEGRW